MANQETKVNEEWRDIENYEGLYQVSNLGNVRRLYLSGKIRVLKPKNDEYLRVDLCKNNKHHYMSIHRLVAKAFIPNDDSDNLTQINHKDENKHNNVVENLEWCTPLYNHRYGTINQRISKSLKGKRKGMPGPNKGKHFSEEARKHMSESAKGRKFSEETRKKLSEAHKGFKQSEEAKQKLRESHLGTHLSDETKKKISEAKKGKQFSEEYKKNLSERMRLWWQKRKTVETED